MKYMSRSPVVTSQSRCTCVHVMLYFMYGFMMTCEIRVQRCVSVRKLFFTLILMPMTHGARQTPNANPVNRLDPPLTGIL